MSILPTCPRARIFRSNDPRRAIYEAEVAAWNAKIEHLFNVAMTTCRQQIEAGNVELGLVIDGRPGSLDDEGILRGYLPAWRVASIHDKSAFLEEVLKEAGENADRLDLALTEAFGPARAAVKAVLHHSKA